MSLEQLEQAVLKLPREERRRFAHWFYEHENDILDPQAEDEISPEVQAILEQRLTEIKEHPELLQPWEGTVERVRERLHELRRQDHSSR
ncbi:MAG: hypothetical protein K0Q55_3954 [Verrucomicrobia bacterium]|jgi:hypothetical protein|nr:hypothetical protein [Verrucomicrobiota bacterium]